MLVFFRGRFTLIEDDHDEVGHLACALSARDAFAFHEIERLAPAGGVDDRDRQAVDVNPLGDQVAGCAGNRRHDGAVSIQLTY